MPDTQPITRRTRFVCISDTHNACPGGAFRLPKGDVIIHAGDLTNQGTFSELKKTVDWLEEADFEKKIIVAGMHTHASHLAWIVDFSVPTRPGCSSPFQHVAGYISNSL